MIPFFSAVIFLAMVHWFALPDTATSFAGVTIGVSLAGFIARCAAEVGRSNT